MDDFSESLIIKYESYIAMTLECYCYCMKFNKVAK